MKKMLPKTIITLLIVFSMLFAFCACGEEAEVKEKTMCSKCGKKESTHNVMGAPFSDNKPHPMCDDCWELWKWANDVQDGGTFG